MHRLLPVAFLILCASIFGLAWIVIEIDPDTAAWYIFAIFIFLLFWIVFCLLGLVLYLLRTRFYRRYSANWYFYTSFKMAFFIAVFIATSAVLAILQLVNLLNILLAILAISLFALWSYSWKKKS
jgi:hypothetical protein